MNKKTDISNLDNDIIKFIVPRLENLVLWCLKSDQPKERIDSYVKILKEFDKEETSDMDLSLFVEHLPTMWN